MRNVIIVLSGFVLLSGCSHHGGASFAELERRLDAREAAAPRGESGGNASTRTSGGYAVAGFADSAPAVFGGDGDRPALPAQVGEEAAGNAPARGPLPGFGDTLARDVRAMPGELWDDTQAVFRSAPNLVILGLTYGGSLALQETGPDDSIEDSYRHNTVLSKSSRDTFNALGHPGLHFALAGSWYLLGQTTQNEQTYNVAKTLFSALIINGLTTMTGQLASWDRAPNGEWGTFPSGHTSSTFTLASVMHDAYGPLVGVPLYGLGVLVAMSRLEDGEHYFSDVVMGGVLGLVVGHTVAGEHDLELFGGKILPFADPNTGSSGIAWVKELKIK